MTQLNSTQTSVWAVILFLFSIKGFAQLPPETPWSTPQTPHPATLADPAYLQTVHDNDYSTDYTKISDASLGNTGGSIQHQYAKVQAWNSDMSFIALGFNIIIDANDYSLYKTFNPALNDARWSNTDPLIRYYGDGEYLKKVNVQTDVITTLHQFPGYGICQMGPWEGNISADDRYVVVTNQAETHATLYDIENDVILSSKSFPNGFDWASITPWGNYIAVSDNETNNTKLYDLDFNFVKILSNLQSHADFAIDINGHQVLVEMCPLRMVRLDNQQETDLLPATTFTNGTCGTPTNNPYICGHVSARSFTSPGWVLISAGIDDCNNDFNGYYHRTELFLLKLDGSGTVKKFGFSRSTYSNYLAQAKASISPDGRKAIFTSDWNINGNGGNSVDYIVEYNNETTYDLTTAISSGNGSISPSSGNFIENSVIQLTATPDAGYIFDSWGGDLSGNTNPASLSMDANKHVTANFVASNPLLAYWKMDETAGSTAMDTGPNALDATLNNPSSSSYSMGLLNGALNINHNNQDAIVVNANLLQPNSFTIASYIKIEPSLNQRGWIAAHGDNMGLFIETDGTLVVYFYDGSTWHNASSSTDLRDGMWHHVAGTYDFASRTVKVYVDGVFSSQNMTGSTISYTLGADFTIGSMREDGETRYFNGDIDELRVYNKALNLTEIQTLLIGPLSVESRYFIGEAQRGGILLHWLTDTELNNKGFEIEHSSNTIDWKMIGFVKGKGTTMLPSKYSYFDKQAHPGTNYYRFKQIDFDENEQYSHLISIFFKPHIINIFPNPTSGKISISNLSSHNAFYELFDQLGKCVKKGAISNAAIDISTLPQGQYVLKIQNGYEVLAFFVVKN